MTDQLDLFPVVVPIEGRGLTMTERFALFHQANPWVYNALVRLARQATSAGRTRLGVAALYEVLRWEHAQQTRGDSFRLNNDFRALYARLIAESEPDLADVFCTRARTAA